MMDWMVLVKGFEIALNEKGMFLLVLAFAQYFFPTFIVYWFMCKLLPNRMNMPLLIIISAVHALWFNLCRLDLVGTSYHLWMNVFINLFTFFIVVFLFKGKYWKRLMIWWFLDTIKPLCETVAFLPVLLYRAARGYPGGWLETEGAVASNVYFSLIYVSTQIILFMLLAVYSLRVWQRLLMQKFQPFYLLFILLPMGYKYALAMVIHPNMGDWLLGAISYFQADLSSVNLTFALFGILTCFVADVAILCFVLSNEKRATIEADLEESKRRLELEQARYEEVEKRSEELAKIRHDLNNQLMSVVQLVRVGENAVAGEIVEALTGEINRGAGE